MRFKLKGKNASRLPLELNIKHVNDGVINDLILGCGCVCPVSQGDQSFRNGETLKDSDKWQI